MEILVVAVVLGIIPAMIAKNKGRSFGVWWLYGAALFIVALPHALLMQTDPAALGQRKCPYCAEFVKREARVCRYCQRELPELRVRSAAPGEICDVCSRPVEAHQHWCSRRGEAVSMPPEQSVPKATPVTPPPWEKKP
jgi:hypothetical protein